MSQNLQRAATRETIDDDYGRGFISAEQTRLKLASELEEMAEDLRIPAGSPGFVRLNRAIEEIDLHTLCAKIWLTLAKIMGPRVPTLKLLDVFDLVRAARGSIVEIVVQVLAGRWENVPRGDDGEILDPEHAVPA